MEDLFLSLIVCTYNRPFPTINLLKSVELQSLKPNEILIIDGSINNLTEELLRDYNFELPLKYFRVAAEDRGLTRQRNFGIVKASPHSKVIAFLDDDVLLDSKYFSSILSSYRNKPMAVGVGGYISNEVNWKYVGLSYQPKLTEFFFEGWVRAEQSRMILRKILGLFPARPGEQPGFSHGLAISYFPPSNQEYLVDFFMGGVASYKKELFDKIRFSEYFEGYGLYEDLHFTLQASKVGELYINTSARLEHHHHPDGRPNSFRYGMMVVKNGWYVWRSNNPEPIFKDILKWWLITYLLIGTRLLNVLTGPNKISTLREVVGRMYGSWISIFKAPK